METLSDDERLAELLRLGVSPNLIKLASGTHLHPAFQTLGIGYPSEDWSMELPKDFVPMWRCGATVTGCQLTMHGLEFVRVYLALAGMPLVRIALTEQGLLTEVFHVLLDHQAKAGEAIDDDLSGAAKAVGFEFYQELKAKHMPLGQTRDLQERAMVALIDSRSKRIETVNPSRPAAI